MVLPFLCSLCFCIYSDLCTLDSQRSRHSYACARVHRRRRHPLAASPGSSRGHQPATKPDAMAEAAVKALLHELKGDEAIKDYVRRLRCQRRLPRRRS